jgi:hypothetical protein
MEYSVESMTTNTMDGDVMFRLNRAWDNRMGSTIQQSTNHSTNTRSQYSERTYTSYAAATVSDQVSGITESDTPRDLRHEELTNKIATLEAIIERLCQQVQVLTNAAAQPQASTDPDVPLNHREKRLDRKESPRKHKQSKQYSAPSGIAEDNHEPAPMDDDRLTVWDDYEINHDNDL